ncbi:branched-chain amino acid ABC transporter permease [Marinibacterium sp. SX1]|uniref:branched-chain amino acid ABC transporter permease n=1 Tax=Marinibacterium sp. SX1 TaxID=3388424 RepID=UPI003D184BE1
MDAFLQIIISGATLGSMYAIGAVGLAMVWGSLGMLNMSHGALLSLGAYASFTVMDTLAIHWAIGLPLTLLVSGLCGLALYLFVVKWMYQARAFDINVVIATVGIAILVENGLIQAYSAYPKRQPLSLDGGFLLGNVVLPYQTLLIAGISLVLVWLIWRFLEVTPTGRSIRATAQNRDAAQLMGVSVGRVFAQVMILAGILAGISGIMVTSIIPMSPTVGYDPMIKAFIVCAVAGLGSMRGTVLVAFAMGLAEALVQYLIGSRYGFPAMLLTVILVLIWRPYGVFGRQTIQRV